MLVESFAFQTLVDLGGEEERRGSEMLRRRVMAEDKD
jgi:hypothetical protein